MRAAARALRADYGGAHDVEAFDEEEVLVLIPSKEESREEEEEEEDALWAGVRRRACHTVPAMCAYIVVLVVVCALRSASASTAAVHTSGGTLEGTSVPRSSVAVPDKNSSKMVLAATVSVVGLGADCCASVRYAPAGGSSSLPPLWTPKACGADPTIQVARLRPATTYAYSVAAACGGGPAAEFDAGTFTSAATGFLRFDAAPYAVVQGTPSWALGSFAVFPGFRAADDKVFEGLLVVDAEGWVVWAYATCMPEAWDRADAETLVVLSRADGACSRESSSGNSAPAAYEKRTSGVVERGTSELHVVDVVSGELLAQHVATCGGDRFDMVTHEARYAADGVVLTATYAPRHVHVSAVTCCDGAGRPDPEATFDVVVGATIDAWDPERGTFETLYDLSDVAPLPDDGARLAGATWNVVDAGCDEKKDALDYFHVSSVSVSEVTGDLVVATRAGKG